MKICKWVFTGIIAGTIALAGCSKGSSVETAPLENSFKAAEAATKSSADKAVASIKAGDYTSALNELKSLASNAKLTPDQQQAIKDVMARVEKAIADAASKAAGEAQKAVNDATKSLPK